jgi:hypothetical protein
METDVCSICLSNIDAQYMKLAPCGHTFHYNYIMEYIKTYGHLQCPVCNETINLTECETNIEFTYIIKDYGNEPVEYKTRRPFVSTDILENIFIETYPIYKILDSDWYIELKENGELKNIFDCFKKEKCIISFTRKNKFYEWINTAERLTHDEYTSHRLLQFVDTYDYNTKETIIITFSGIQFDAFSYEKRKVSSFMTDGKIIYRMKNGILVELGKPFCLGTYTHCGNTYRMWHYYISDNDEVYSIDTRYDTGYRKLNDEYIQELEENIKLYEQFLEDMKKVRLIVDSDERFDQYYKLQDRIKEKTDIYKYNNVNIQRFNGEIIISSLPRV